jgi:hypothetical protein
VFVQHGLAKLVRLAERYGLHTGTLKPKAKAADTAEQIKHLHGLSAHTQFDTGATQESCLP